jgi:hypothetical protein
MSFKVLYLKEHIAENVKEIDSEIMIFYDPIEGSYFYYGSRRRNINDHRYVTYSGSYHYTRMTPLVNFLKYTLNEFKEVITTEFHDVYIHECEYLSLDFHKLQNKISRKTEIAAYDSTLINSTKLYELLDTMLTHEI